MVLRRESRLVKWAFWMEKTRPDQTSLCALFWRAVLIAPAMAALVLAMAAVLAPVLIPVFLFEKVSERHEQRGELSPMKRFGYRVKDSLLWQTLSAKKRQVCPVITIEAE